MNPLLNFFLTPTSIKPFFLASATMRNLEDLSEVEFKEFIDSFDFVLSDCDGVIIHLYGPLIPGSSDTINAFRDLGKKIYFVTHNTTVRLNDFVRVFKSLNARPEEFISPTFVITRHLKKINFAKKIFFLGHEAAREHYEAVGFRIAEREPHWIEENVKGFNANLENFDPEVGAVLVDWDININHPMMMKAVKYLQNEDVLFLVGADDLVAPYAIKIPGPGIFLKGLEIASDRKATHFGKPSENLKRYFEENTDVDPKRTLFIGDMLDADCAFANLCGYKKLFVLSGLNTLKEAESSENNKPDFYVENLAVLHQLMKKYKLI